MENWALDRSSSPQPSLEHLQGRGQVPPISVSQTGVPAPGWHPAVAQDVMSSSLAGQGKGRKRKEQGKEKGRKMDCFKSIYKLKKQRNNSCMDE